MPGARIGDSFDVIGGGVDTRLVAGYGSSPSVAGNNGFALFDTEDGVNYASTSVSITTFRSFCGTVVLICALRSPVWCVIALLS